MSQRKPSKGSKTPSRSLLRSKARLGRHQSPSIEPAVCNSKSKDPNPYKYRALDTSRQEIRILRLENVASAGSTADDPIQPTTGFEPIYGSITHVPLSEVHDFVALSYTWGKPERKHSLLVGSDRIPITRNLHQALLHLRRRTELTHLWIDAICVNQKDEDERSSQVQLMSKIFQSAREAISWIGTHDEYTSFLFGLVRGLSLDEVEARSCCEVRTLVNKAITMLGRRPYWTRVWVLQEFAVAKRVRIMCSDDLEDSTLICGLAARFMRLKSQSELLQVSPFHTMVISRRRYQDKRPIGLLEMLMIVTTSADENLFDRVIRRTLQSTDIIDQVYGILGLVCDQQMFVLEPDYKITNLNELFIDMTRRFVSISGQIEICFLQHGKEAVNPENLGVKNARCYAPSKLPGWCPDYLNLVDSTQNGELINALESTRQAPVLAVGSKHRNSSRRLSWNATAESRLTDGSYLLLDDGRMILSGKLLGTIISPLSWETSVAPSAFMDDKNELSCFSWLNPLLFAYGVGPVASKDRILDALSFLSGDAKCSLEAAFENTPSDLKCCEHRAELKKKLLGGAIPDDLAFSIVRRLSKWSIATEQLTAVSSETLEGVVDEIAFSLLSSYDCLGRKIAAYKPNKLDASVSRVAKGFGAYGWIPSSARADDELWLLKGCSMPIVLRRLAHPMAAQGSTFARIGPALVNGAMNGEMWSENDLSRITVVRTLDTVVTPSARTDPHR